MAAESKYQATAFSKAYAEARRKAQSALCRMYPEDFARLLDDERVAAGLAVKGEQRVKAQPKTEPKAKVITPKPKTATAGAKRGRKTVLGDAEDEG